MIFRAPTSRQPDPWRLETDGRRTQPLPAASRRRGPPAARLEPLAEAARAYARAATSPNTHRAYAADWRDYLRWRARHGLDARPLADWTAASARFGKFTGDDR